MQGRQHGAVGKAPPPAASQSPKDGTNPVAIRSAPSEHRSQEPHVRSNQREPVLRLAAGGEDGVVHGGRAELRYALIIAEHRRHRDVDFPAELRQRRRFHKRPHESRHPAQPALVRGGVSERGSNAGNIDGLDCVGS